MFPDSRRYNLFSKLSLHINISKEKVMEETSGKKAIVLCGGCDALLGSEDEFCYNCGRSLIKCRVCGVEFTTQTPLYCSKCGANQNVGMR